MYKTPFDKIVVEFLEKALSTHALKNRRLDHIISFTQICRVRYRQMSNSSERHWQEVEKMGAQDPGQGTITYKDLADNSADSIETKSNYFSFIEDLNRFGRIFLNEYNLVLPYYYRIRFYRNKMVEHWDEYEKYLSTPRNGTLIGRNKLAIPYHIGAASTPAIKKAVFDKLKNELSKAGVVIPLGNIFLMDISYSDFMFESLEKIDSTLHKIPRELVNTLFTYSFPTPIHDLEDYCDRLAAWLEEGFSSTI